jgi:D-aminoacyl-tRNA deacylase
MTEKENTQLKVLVESSQDPSSKSISTYITEHYPFRPGAIPGILTYNGYAIYRSEERHLNMNGLEAVLADLGIKASTIIFLSKHSSQAKIRSLTVHAMGNIGEALLGGFPHQVSMSDPGNMSSALRIMRKNPVEGFNITFEATHHGPLVMTPSFFIEIGTEKEDWENNSALDTVSKAVMNCSDDGKGGFLGIGGGHYSPKITEYAVSSGINVGHILSKHTHEFLTVELLKQCMARTKGFRGFLMDLKGTRGPIREMVRNVASEGSFELIAI